MPRHGGWRLADGVPRLGRTGGRRWKRKLTGETSPSVSRGERKGEVARARVVAYGLSCWAAYSTMPFSFFFYVQI